MADSEGRTELLRDFWYLAVPARRLTPGRTLGKTLLGEPVVLGRAADGTPFALADFCPHRGMPLRHGELSGGEITCCYHGWKFAPDGRCTEVPSLVAEERAAASRIRVRSYPCREVQGNVWVFFAREGRAPEEPLPDVPLLPGVGNMRPQVDCSLVYPLNADHAAYTLMDPAHTAYVHTWWWWKRRRRALREKSKEFEPAPLGWRQKRHRAPKENRVYRLLGNDVTTEITYRLPGMRIEAIQGERHTAVSLLIITPIDEARTEVHQCLYWTLSWLDPLKPVFRRLIHNFLDQDRVAAVKHLDGLRHDPPLMLFGDIDAQAKWFFRLKREWVRAQEEDRAFANPLTPQTLRWRS
jgi:phenylpropionate dioxygenase-like ring-hydroxylating dioxygenase large terminal subunit